MSPDTNYGNTVFHMSMLHYPLLFPLFKMLLFYFIKSYETKPFYESSILQVFKDKKQNSFLFSGRFWRTLSGKRQRWSLVFGGHHKLGHWLCRTQPTRGLHPNLKIYRLDTLKCHLKLLKKTIFIK